MDLHIWLGLGLNFLHVMVAALALVHQYRQDAKAQ